MEETSRERQKRYTSGQAQNLLKEYGALLEAVIKEVLAEYSGEINESTAEATAMKYMKNQGARQALGLLMQRLNSKSNE